MARGGFCKLPDGTVVVALTLPAPVPDGTAAATQGGDGGTVRVLVRAVNRSRALTRLRNLGLGSVYLRGNLHPPSPDEVTAVLHHPDGLIWRTAPLRPNELWHPISALFRAPGADPRPAPGAVPLPRAASSGPGPGPDMTSRIPDYLVPKPLTVPEAWTATGT